MLKVITEIDSFKKLDKHIDFVNKMLQMKTDKSFQEFMQKKCLETIRKVAEQRFATHTTTNEDLKAEYLNNNKLKDITDDGFVIYNDLSVPKPDTKFSDGYTFSVALAFEYGTGFVGMGSVNAPASYQYNVNKNYVVKDDEVIYGWWLSILKNGNNPHFGANEKENAVITGGYEGMEIYRFSAIEIQKNLKKWVNEYFRKK